MNRHHHPIVSLTGLTALTAALLLASMPALAGPSGLQTGRASWDVLEHEKFTHEELKELVGPVALYPDPLLAQVLAGATYPLEIVQAARFLDQHADDPNLYNRIDRMPWDPSVLALTRYPSVIEMMNEHLEWTQSLGVAFMYQQEDLMFAVQILRQQARDHGHLQTTQQQQVVVEREVIRIVPASPRVIYVPYYEPHVVFVYPRPVVYHRPIITFSAGFSVGSWLHLDFNWHRRHVCYGGWYHYHHVRPGRHVVHHHHHHHHPATQQQNVQQNVNVNVNQNVNVVQQQDSHVGQQWQRDNSRAAPRVRGRDTRQVQAPQTSFVSRDDGTDLTSRVTRVERSSEQLGNPDRFRGPSDDTSRSNARAASFDDQRRTTSGSEARSRGSRDAATAESGAAASRSQRFDNARDSVQSNPTVTRGSDRTASRPTPTTATRRQWQTPDQQNTPATTNNPTATVTRGNERTADGRASRDRLTPGDTPRINTSPSSPRASTQRDDAAASRADAFGNRSGNRGDDTARRSTSRDTLTPRQPNTASSPRVTPPSQRQTTPTPATTTPRQTTQPQQQPTRSSIQLPQQRGNTATPTPAARPQPQPQSQPQTPPQPQRQTQPAARPSQPAAQRSSSPATTPRQTTQPQQPPTRSSIQLPQQRGNTATRTPAARPQPQPQTQRQTQPAARPSQPAAQRSAPTPARAQQPAQRPAPQPQAAPSRQERSAQAAPQRAQRPAPQPAARQQERTEQRQPAARDRSDNRRGR